jgi:MFS family permease
VNNIQSVENAKKIQEQNSDRRNSITMPASRDTESIVVAASTSSHPVYPLHQIDIEIDLQDEGDFPEGGTQAWTAVLSAVLILYSSFGFMVTIGTLQDYWHEHQLRIYSSRDVGWIPSVFVYLALALGIWVGPCSDKYGPRYIALLGSMGYVIMMFLLAECKTFWQFLLCCGVLGGISGATLTTTSLAVVSQWFKKKRGFVHGIAMAGSAFGGLTQPLILRATLERYGYAWSIRILAFIFTAFLIVGNLLMRTRLKPTGANEKRNIITLSIFKDLRFSLLTVSVFGFEVVLFGTLGILPTYATLNTNFGPSTGFYLISVMNGTSCFGRLLPGYISDKIGRFNTLLISIVFTLFFMLVLWLPFGTKSLVALYSFSSIFGFGSGCWMAMTPACIGQLCKAEDFGRYYGTLYFLASLSTLICIPISGELAESVGPQALVGFYCVVLGISLLTFCGSRFECLDRKWKWAVKI